MLDSEILKILYGLQEHLILLGYHSQERSHCNDIPDARVIVTHMEKKIVSNLAWRRLELVIKELEIRLGKQSEW